jgi:hypothetical protein
MFNNKFKFFKHKSQPKQEGREVETAVVIMLYADGGPVIPILKVEGIKQRREATMNDLYRMVNDVKGQVDEIRTTESVVNALIQMHQPRPAPNAPVPRPAPVNPEKKAEKVEEIVKEDRKEPVEDITHKEGDETHKASEDNKK